MENVQEDNLNTLLQALKALVTPSEKLNTASFDGVFCGCVQRAINVLGFDDISKLSPLGERIITETSETWDYVETALYILCSLKKILGGIDLSVSQQKDIRSCLQFIVSLGLCPYLIKGVGLPLSSRSSFVDKLNFDDASVLLKYERLCIVVKYLLYCSENATLRSLIMSNILEDVLAGLFQLSFAPLKKPERCVDPVQEKSGFVMSLNFWNKCQEDQVFFQQKLLKLVNESHQPTVMQKLMFLQAEQGGRKPPVWLKKKCSSALTNCLIKSGGVSALIRATFDSEPDIGADWEKVETLARLITSPLNHIDNIADQILNLLQSFGIGSSNVSVVVVACIKQLYKQDAHLCRALIIGPVLQPFLFCCMDERPDKNVGIVLSEEMMLSSFSCIYNCFSAHASQVSSNSLPILLLDPCISFLFRLYCKINGSASHMCAHVEEILFRILSGSDSSDMVKILRCILFGECVEGIPLFSHNLCFNFGSCGGVQVEEISESQGEAMQFPVEEAGDNLVILLEHQDSKCQVSVTIFVALIRLLVDVGLNTCKEELHEPILETMEDTLDSLIYSSQRQLGIVRILAILVEKENVQRELAKDPIPILEFFLPLLKSVSELVYNSPECNDSDLHCVFVPLMILSVMVEKCNESTNWTPFEELLNPIADIRDRSKNAELSRLASSVYNSIAIHGVFQRSNSDMRDNTTKKTRCESALHDSCDPLVPVRGHAIVELTKLLWERDHETISKKDAVFCVLKENLKSEDSFLYLAAVNGMVAMAAFQPEQAVKLLVEEYVECTMSGDGIGRNPDLRMKVGEVLVKLTNALGDMAHYYKTDLLNAFLLGAKDEDHLMRASSLSNLGEVCRILGFRTGPILQEIFMCVQSIANFDKAVEPRRASVMVVTLLIQGLDKEALTVLKDVLLDLYRSLKYLYLNDNDDVVRLHAQLALQELGKAARDFIFPQLKFEKKIHML